MKLLSYSSKQLAGLMLLLLAAFAGSCNDPSSQLPEAPSMSELSDVIYFSEEGGTQTISFSTNRAWTASLMNNLTSANEPWCELSAESGAAGPHKIAINVTPLQGDYREAILLLNASATGAEIVISQSGQPVITTNEASDINEAKATLSGAWRYSGEIEVSEFGFEVATKSNGTYTRYPVAEKAEDGSFAYQLTALSAETSYLYRIYIQTPDVVYTGEVKEFKTDKAAAPIAVSTLKEAIFQLAKGGSKNYTENDLIKGVVIAAYAADETQAASLLLQDGTQANSGIRVILSEQGAATYQKGNYLEVRLKYGKMEHSEQGLASIVAPADGIRLLENNKSVEVVAVDHTKLADYEAMCVAIEQSQLTRLFTNATNYPTWSAAELWGVEVNGSEKSYSIHVPANSALASQVPATGSGTVKGLVELYANGEYVLCCQKSEDVAGLTNDRFASLLDLAFLQPEFKGSLVVDEPASGSVVIPYRNGDYSTLPGTISVEVSGEAAEGISVASVTDFQIGAGSGEITLAVSGTPTTAGVITFTVIGLDELGNKNSCTAEVIAPAVPEVGNFEAIWNTGTAKGDSVMKLSSNSNASIEVSDWTLHASSSNITATKWADFAATGWDANESVLAPVQYFETTLKVGVGAKLVLSGMDITHRINGGDVTLSVQYAINGGAFAEIESMLLTSATEPFTVNLGKVAALTSVVEGSVVTIRLVPKATSSSIKWGIKAKSRFAVYGNVE
ncbi:MAG: BACON domain-containing protein [Alistipes sp.]|nr:BACON domain-containing protein [Alistipes sp.]